MTSTQEHCIFCDIISGKAPAHIIKQDENVIVFLSLEGHPLVVPTTHIPDVFSLDPENAAHIMREAVAVSKALREVCNCDGINLIQSNGSAAGQDVFHFHLHIKPRWTNDDVIIRWNTDAEEEQERLELGRRIRARL
ncbi:HIT family protein [Nisaea nitritireducens]|uniref:HIT family protein n=1 Tax=Nisaea nitritireducens TaxID=568392 RepID=UPI001868609D|nr:HIT family protein [Nisaea nitritireducens]